MIKILWNTLGLNGIQRHCILFQNDHCCVSSNLSVLVASLDKCLTAQRWYMIQLSEVPGKPLTVSWPVQTQIWIHACTCWSGSILITNALRLVFQEQCLDLSVFTWLKLYQEVFLLCMCTYWMAFILTVSLILNSLAFFSFRFPTANSQYIHNAYTNVRRPPLPDYHSATHMTQLARSRHQWQSLNGGSGRTNTVPTNYYEDGYDDANNGRCLLSCV